MDLNPEDLLATALPIGVYGITLFTARNRNEWLRVLTGIGSTGSTDRRPKTDLTERDPCVYDLLDHSAYVILLLND
eukprot:8303071-Ditylum_brightwellii.AAC.1